MTTLTAMTPRDWRRAGARCLPALALLGTALLGTALLGAAPPVQAKPSWTKPGWTSGTFVYADLCTRPESGARVGQRIVLRRSPNGDALTYEDAERPGPVAAEAMSVDDATRAIAFAVETGSGAIRFEGIAGADAFTGTVADAGGTHGVRLPRVLRSHAHEACPGETTGSIGRKR